MRGGDTIIILGRRRLRLHAEMWAWSLQATQASRCEDSLLRAEHGRYNTRGRPSHKCQGLPRPGTGGGPTGFAMRMLCVLKVDSVCARAELSEALEAS